MIKLPVETATATLRYALVPDEAGIAAMEATFAAYDRMMAILAEVAPVGANLVSLHAQAYERIRKECRRQLAAPDPARRQVVCDQGTNFTDH
jgi:hypothetical protein